MYMPEQQHVHMTQVTLTELRSRLFELADNALTTGEPVSIRRNGRELVLKRASEPDPRDRLLAWLDVAEAAGPATMSEADRKMFDLSDIVEAPDADQPELYD